MKNGQPVAASGTQRVILTLSEPVDAGSVSVYHWDGSAWVLIPSTVVGNTIIFETDSFSPFAVVYSAGSVAAGNIAAEVEVSLEKVTNTEYNIVLQARTEN